MQQSSRFVLHNYTELPKQHFAVACSLGEGCMPLLCGGWGGNLIQFHPLSTLLFDFSAICRSCQYADPHLLDIHSSHFSSVELKFWQNQVLQTESCDVQLATRCNCYHLLAKTSSYFLACWRGAICTNHCWSGIIFWTYQSLIGCLLRISHQCIGYFLELP